MRALENEKRMLLIKVLRTEAGKRQGIELSGKNERIVTTIFLQDLSHFHVFPRYSPLGIDVWSHRNGKTTSRTRVSKRAYHRERVQNPGLCSSSECLGIYIYICVYACL